jgi:hypothetical protein
LSIIASVLRPGAGKMTGAGRQKVSSLFWRPNLVVDEIILAQSRSHPEAEDFLSRRACDDRAGVWELGSMVEIIMLLLVLFSAGIFLAHAIKAYQAQ